MTPVSSASPWYRDTFSAAAISPEVAERALEWLIQLQEPFVPPEIHEEWVRWRAAHPDHERAWQRIESVSGKLRPLASPFNSALAQAALLPAASNGRRRAIKTLALLIFAGGAVWSLEEYAPWREWTSDYRTAIGQRRTLSLPDGTSVVLNTDSAIDIRFDAEERRVKLVSGEIFIATAPDTGPTPRPFLVETQEGTAEALGTRYSVRQRDGDTEVGVFQGAVRIRPWRDTDRTLVLRAGYGATYSARMFTDPRPVEASRIAWKDGFIVARSMRLDDFIAELGRYHRAALSCDPGIAGLRVSGSFPLRDIDQVLRTVATTLDAGIEIHTRFWGRKAMRLVPTHPGAE